jgi:hypothetical protein
MGKRKDFNFQRRPPQQSLDAICISELAMLIEQAKTDHVRFVLTVSFVDIRPSV